jgi:hypothetical protein
MIPTMSERDERPERVEDQARADETIHVELAQKLDRCHPALVHLVDILLEPATDVLQDLVNDADGESRVVALEVVSEHREQAHIPILDLPRLRENLMQRPVHGFVFPVQLAKELEHLVDGLLAKNVINKVPDE